MGVNLETIAIIAGIALAVIVALIIIVVIVSKSSANKKRRGLFNINVEQFITAIGGINNIIKVSSNNSRLVFNVVDISIVDSAMFRSLGASGVVKSGQKVTVIVGKLSEDIANVINEKLK